MTLTTQPLNTDLDLTAGVGQRSESFRFVLINGLTGGPIGELTPLRTGTLSHDTNRTIKRSLSLSLGVADTAAINPISDRLDLYMTVNGTEYPLGRYVFTNFGKQRFTSGDLSSMTLTDEMYIIDQAIEVGFTARSRAVSYSIGQVLADYPFTYTIEGSDFIAAQSWSAGTRRGQVLADLSLAGDYFTPWFGNDKVLHFIRSFDPVLKVPAFDLDAGRSVSRGGIQETNDLLTAPNRFVVISNAAEDGQAPVYGSADIAPSAPHSIANRGFVIPDVRDLQLSTSQQAVAVARSLAVRQSVLEYVNLSTVIDPRHDSYDVVHWDNQLWLEVAWSISLAPGTQMTHTLSKAYS